MTLPDQAVAAVKAHGQVKYLQLLVSGPFVPQASGKTNLKAASAAFSRAPNSSPPWNSGPYTYDGAGNISSIGPGSVSTDNFVYDPVSRLSQATVRGHTEHYYYDAFGNLTSKNTDGVIVDLTTNTATNHFAYHDSQGNLVGISRTTPRATISTVQPGHSTLTRMIHST